jgi:site-specific DNA-methyltransferase (adenine-specific)
MKPYYEDEFITLYNADCLSVLPTLPRFHVMLTDPPYPNDPRFPATWDFIGRFAAASWDAAEDNAWLVSDFQRSHLPEWLAIYKPWVYVDMLAANVSNSMALCRFGFDYFTPSIVMAKGTPKVSRRWSNLIPAVRVCKSHEWFGHPSPKYVSVYSRYIAMLLPQNGLLVDPFAGSGTSLVACKRLNRKAIGIEINEAYCRIIIERLSQCELGLGTLEAMEVSETAANSGSMQLPLDFA